MLCKSENFLCWYAIYYSQHCSVTLVYPYCVQRLQDVCLHQVRTAEQMVSSGHYAGVEARARCYNVLEAATALHETCDTRTVLLSQAVLFFKLAQTVRDAFISRRVTV